MNKFPMPFSQPEDTLDTVTSDMLGRILEDDSSLPWDIADDESEDYLSDVEDNFSLVDCLDDDELIDRAEGFYSHLNQYWNDSSNLSISSAKQSILDKFGHLVPSQWLDSIITSVNNVIDLNLSPAEQLMECVKPLLSHVAEDDLRVWARPLVYSMRSKNETMRGKNETKQTPWEELSEIERARLTLKVAQETLNQYRQQDFFSNSQSDGE